MHLNCNAILLFAILLSNSESGILLAHYHNVFIHQSVGINLKVMPILLLLLHTEWSPHRHTDCICWLLHVMLANSALTHTGQLFISFVCVCGVNMKLLSSQENQMRHRVFVLCVVCITTTVVVVVVVWYARARIAIFFFCFVTLTSEWHHHYTLCGCITHQMTIAKHVCSFAHDLDVANQSEWVSSSSSSRHKQLSVWCSIDCVPILTITISATMRISSTASPTVCICTVWPST